MDRWSRTRAALCAAWLAAVAASCDRPNTVRTSGAQPALSHGHPAAAHAATPVAPAPERPGFDTACFDVYAECEAVAGLPALAGDGRHVAVADFGPADPRDEFILSVLVLAVASGAVSERVPLLTHDDRRRWADLATGDLAPEFRVELDRRALSLERMLAAARYRPLEFLGTVHEQATSGGRGGLEAGFDGAELAVTDVTTGAVEWRRAIAPAPRRRTPDGLDCGPSPVADIAVWIDRAAHVAVARVAYISSDSCDDAPVYVVWR